MADVTRDPLVRVRIGSVGNRTRAAWAEDLHVHLPLSLLVRTGWRQALRPDSTLDIPAGPAPISADEVTALRERRAFTERAPLSARLPVNYRIAPGWMRSGIASAIGRRRRRHVDRWAEFPEWPIDLSTDVLDDLRDAAEVPAPAERPTPVVLTHDIDSAEGLKNLVERFLPMEEAVGARSTSYVVPCAWRLDHGLVAEIIARGHEVGVHGYDHANRTPFATAAERARRLDAARSFAERYGATGYRAPSLLRTRALLRGLSSRYLYDSSIPTAGGLYPTANNGCATARPFLVEDMIELPVTLPRDGSLRFLGYRPCEIVDIWIQCADRIARSRGVIVLLTHCERRFSGHPEMLRAYSAFLETASTRSDRFMFSRPGSVLDSMSLQTRTT
jgi:peptidoglycan/xylan/chitin deacetylase (PgdA/CDA1 family)